MRRLGEITRQMYKPDPKGSNMDTSIPTTDLRRLSQKDRLRALMAARADLRKMDKVRILREGPMGSGIITPSRVMRIAAIVALILLSAPAHAQMLCIDLTTRMPVECPTAPDPLPSELLAPLKALDLLHLDQAPAERPETAAEKGQRLAYEYVTRLISNWPSVRHLFLGPNRIYVPRQLLLLQQEYPDASARGGEWIAAAEFRFIRKLAEDAWDLTVYRSPSLDGDRYSLKGPLLLTWIYGKLVEAGAPEIDMGPLWYARGSALAIESEEPEDAEFLAFLAAVGERP